MVYEPSLPGTDRRKPIVDPNPDSVTGPTITEVVDARTSGDSRFTTTDADSTGGGLGTRVLLGAAAVIGAVAVAWGRA